MPADSEPQEIKSISLRARIWQGALLGLGLATVFYVFLGIAGGEWIFMPVITVTISGVIGGVFFFIFDQLGPEKGWSKVLFRILGFAFMPVYCG